MRAFILLSILFSILFESKATSELTVPIFRVATIVDPPFMYQYVDNNCTVTVTGIIKEQEPTACYKGLVMDLLKIISQDVQLNFTMEKLETEYGSLANKEKGEWKGVIGVLQNKSADIGLAAFNVTKERAEVVEFSETFTVKVGNSTNSYALTFPKGSKLTKTFSDMIKKLTNQRYIEQLVEKWFYDNPERIDVGKYIPGKH